MSMSAILDELEQRCSFYERQNAEQGKLLNQVIAERDELQAKWDYYQRFCEDHNAHGVADLVMQRDEYRSVLERYCDDKCNAEYNPCEARKALAKYPRVTNVRTAPYAMTQEELNKWSSEDAIEQARRMT